MMPYTEEEMDWICQSASTKEQDNSEDRALLSADQAMTLAEWQARVWTTPEAWEPKGPKVR